MQSVMNDTWLELDNTYQAREGFTRSDPVARCLERSVLVVEFKVVVCNCLWEMVVTRRVRDAAVALCGTGVNNTCGKYNDEM